MFLMRVWWTGAAWVCHDVSLELHFRSMAMARDWAWRNITGFYMAEIGRMEQVGDKHLVSVYMFNSFEFVHGQCENAYQSIDR